MCLLKFIKNRITVIGCPKLDNIDYTDKLTEIIGSKEIKAFIIMRYVSFETFTFSHALAKPNSL